MKTELSNYTHVFRGLRRRVPVPNIRHLSYVIRFVGIWLTVSCLGYGLAVRKYSDMLAKKNAEVHPPVEGLIASVDIGWLKSSGVKFTMRNRGEYFIPPEHIDGDAEWNVIKEKLKPGIPAWVVVSPGENIVMGMSVHPRAPGYAGLLNFPFALAVRKRYQESLASKVMMILAGSAMIPVIGELVIRFLRRRWPLSASRSSSSR